MKHSWIVVIGIWYGYFNLATVDNIWMARGFQVNFMYENVLQRLIIYLYHTLFKTFML